MRRASLPALLLAALVGGLATGAEPAAGDPPALAVRIRKALDRGRDHIASRLPGLLAEPGNYPMGRIALAMAAFLRTGAPTDHKSVSACLNALDRLPMRETYSVACYLIALDAYVQAKKRETRQATLTDGTSSNAAAWVRPKMEALVRWLVTTRNPGAGTWSYTGPGGHDYSNTQFAVLGLQIGLEHRIQIPAEVFGEIARQFAGSLAVDGDWVDFTVTYGRDRKKLFTKQSSETLTYRLRVGGWGYTSQANPAYASMTAAGASSLLVARNGLGSLSAQAENALQSALGWIGTNFKEFLNAKNFRFYYLYSLEKVGDLGDILSFNGHDWYAEGAELILSRQEEDGGFGQDLADTSLAILFLTRATRSAVKAVPPPRVVTQAAGVDVPGQDLVYIQTIDAYISAREFLEFLAEDGQRDLQPVAEQVVRNYPLNRQGELVPPLLGLWGLKGWLGAFAQQSLFHLTGEKYKDPADYRRWHESYAALAVLEKEPRLDSERARALLQKAPGARLRGRLVDLIRRQRLVACAPDLIEELRTDDDGYRQRVREVLEHLTGQTISSGGEPVAPAREAGEWRALWAMHGKRIEAAERIRRGIAALEAGEGESAVAVLIPEGRAAVPFLIDAMSREEFSLWVPTALERLTGERLGLRPAAWRAWWKESGER